MLNPIISNIAILTEMLISYIFFANMFEKRFSTLKCLGSGCILYALCSTANLLSGNNGIVNLLSTTLINALFCWCCFESGFRLSIFYAVIFSAINGAIETGVVSIVGAITGTNIFDYNQNVPLLIIECSCSRILLFCVILVFSKIVRTQTISAKLPFNLLLYPVSTAICQIIFWYINTLPETPYTTQNLLAVASLFLLTATILLFVTYQHQLEKDNESLRLKSEFEKLQTEKSYFEILEVQNEHLMIYAHDAKKHLEAINNLNRDPQISSYLSKLSDQLTEYTRYCHSGNKLLDVMIHKYCVDCEMRGIRFDYDVKLCNLRDIEDIDMVAILGNLIDNAITAAEKSMRKNISLETAKRNSYCIIIITNSCDIPPKEVGGKLVTSKLNRNSHGYGLRSVRKVLKKYEGDFEWAYDKTNKTFTVTVMVGGRTQANIVT